jgi:hypothetical protein
VKRSVFVITAALFFLWTVGSLFPVAAVNNGFVILPPTGAANLSPITNTTTPGDLTWRAIPNAPNGLAFNTSTHLYSALSAGAGGLHVVTFAIDGGGSAITTGDIKNYPTADYACTIIRIDISADQSGSITVDVWKAAGAIPTSGNKISASAPLTLSSAQLAQNGSLSGWTTAVAVGDVFGFNVATATTVTKAIGQIWCQ